MDKLKKWLNSQNKDYDEGIGYLAKYSKKRNLLFSLQKRHKLSKLVYELRKIYVANTNPKALQSVKDTDPEQMTSKERAEQAGKLVAKIEKATNQDELDTLLERYNNLVESLPQNVKQQMLAFAHSRMPKFQDTNPENQYIHAENLKSDAEKEAAKIIENAEDEAQDIIENAETQAEENAEEVIEEAQQKAYEILASATDVVNRKIIKNGAELNIDNLPDHIKALWDFNREAYKEIRSRHEKLKLLVKAPVADRKPHTMRIAELGDTIRSNWNLIDNWDPNAEPEPEPVQTIDHKRISANRKYISTNVPKLKLEKDSLKAETLKAKIQARVTELVRADVMIADDTRTELKALEIEC